MAEVADSNACCRIARYDDCLDVFCHEKGEGVVDVLKYLSFRLCPIGNVIFVSKEDELFMRHDFHGVVEDAKAAYTGIKKCYFHGVHLLKAVWCPFIIARFVCYHANFMIFLYFL